MEILLLNILSLVKNFDSFGKDTYNNQIPKKRKQYPMISEIETKHPYSIIINVVKSKSRPNNITNNPIFVAFLIFPYLMSII